MGNSIRSSRMTVQCITSINHMAWSIKMIAFGVTLARFVRAVATITLRYHF